MRKTYITILTLAATAFIGSAAAANRIEPDSSVTMLWGKQVDRTRTTGSARSYSESDIEKYPSVDLRNSLTGVIPGLEVVETAGNISPFSNSNITSLGLNSNNTTLISRGSSSIICIVDDVPVPFNELLLDVNQVESITLVKDVVDKAAFGPLASDGALIIKTKRGRYNTPTRVRVDMESGVGTIGRLPEWVGGTEYASLNNSARQADGLQILYPDVTNYQSGDPYSLAYPNVDYRSLMLRNVKPLAKVGVRIDGGTSGIGYNININGTRDEGIYKVGPDNSFNKINFMSRVSTKLGRYVEASVGFIGTLSFLRDNMSDFTDFRSTPAIAFPLTLGQSSGESDAEADLEGTTIYGVSKSFPNNPYAQLIEGGFSTTRSRSSMFNTSVDVDLSWLLKGLKSRTYVNLNSFYSGIVQKKNDYLAYYWDLSTGTHTEISEHKGVKASGKSLDASSTYQQFNVYEKLSYDYAANGNALTLDATVYLSDASQNRNDNNFERQLNLIFSGNYSYKNRYVVEAVAQYAGSSRFSRENRYRWFPSAGGAWIVSNEDFLKDSEKIDFLKLRAQYGTMGASDVFGTDFLYEADYSLTNGMKFGPVTSNKWFGSSNRTSKYSTINRLANPDLTWETINQFDLGFDAVLLNSWSVSMNYFSIKHDGIIANIAESIPDIYGWNGIEIYDNYNQTVTRGAELAIAYSKSFGDFAIRLGGSAAYYKTLYTRYFGDTYAYSDYQKQAGKSTDVYWGYVCSGKYESQEQIDNGPMPLSEVKIGDLIYEDLNGDNVIDDKDMKEIGNTAPRLRYSLNFGMSYKNFDLTIVGTGRAFYQTPMTNDYFWNGWGDDNYSAFVRDNVGEAYPRLAYEKSTSNFQPSTFWLRNGSFFKIQNIELGYNFPQKGADNQSRMRLFVRGANLLTVSNIKDVDPEYINSGVTSYPMFRTFTAGVKLVF